MPQHKTCGKCGVRKITQLANALFEKDARAAKRWLHAENEALGGQKPIDAVREGKEGRVRVENLLRDLGVVAQPSSCRKK